MSKILLVDDDKNIIEAIEYNLRLAHHEVIKATDGIQAVELARREKPNLVILDLMLPNLDGLDVCRILRRETDIPILMLTAKTDETDKIVGLELGADDYVTKPFELRELMARIRSLLRRGQPKPTQEIVSSLESAESKLILKGHNIELDYARHHVTLNKNPITLTRKEFELLAFLMRNRGQVFSREHLMDKVWGYAFDGSARTVDVHIRWLRQKLEENPASPKILVTVHGFGYRFEI